MTSTVTKQTKTPKTTNTTKPDNMTLFGGSPGRGWHLRKEYVAPNGKIYSFGKLVSEAKVVAG